MVSIGELRAGVERAPDAAVRAIRAEWLDAIERAFPPIPVDLEIARRFGELPALARRERRIRRTGDLLIIATAGVTGRERITHDAAQAGLADAAGVPVNLLDAPS
ncbi:MAG: PIN domain-containing protein [Thermoleophilia bacterium]|nr:PIN domain-containing protein [Thermoleophilia bacterium]